MMSPAAQEQWTSRNAAQAEIQNIFHARRLFTRAPFTIKQNSQLQQRQLDTLGSIELLTCCGNFLMKLLTNERATKAGWAENLL